MIKHFTEEEISHICNLIKKWETLPIKYKEILFGKEIEKKEYELKYWCKKREEDIIANTMAAPLQKVKTFHSDGIIDHQELVRNSKTKKIFLWWYNKLIFGDNLQVLKTLLTDTLLRKQIQEQGGIKLIYIDPPFATKQDFQPGKWEKAYSDKIAWAEFIEFLRERLILMRELLADDGSIYVHLDPKKSHYLKLVLDEVFGESNFRNEIIWNYKRRTGSSDSFQKMHDTIFRYTKSSKRTYNAMWQPFSEKTSVAKYKRILMDWRAVQDKSQLMERKNENWVAMNDVWDISYLHPVAIERTNYPTQKPEALLERILKASSNEWDIIMDAFLGSGTTVTVAEKLWRKWIGIDCGKLAIYTVQNRLMNLYSDIWNKWKKVKPAPFAVYNAWLYDYKILANLDWPTYIWFVLSLFQCKKEYHEIEWVPFDGFLWLDHVQIFDYNHGREWISLDKWYLENIEIKIGKQLTKRVFIIAPASRVDFFDTSVTIWTTEYHILRVPYSIINELANNDNREKIQQPKSEDDVNNTVNAVWFDFMQAPKVEVTYIRNKNDYMILIDTFISKAILKKYIKYDNYETLSMVIIDYNYNGQYVSFEEVLFADSIKKNNYHISINANKLKDQCMIIYIDIFGNEKREIISINNFK